MDTDREPRAVLGVGRFATWREIRTAYWTLARRFHPDGTSPDAERMAEVNGAYEALERESRRLGDRPPLRPMGPGVGAPAAQAGFASPDVAAPMSPAPDPARGSLLGRILAAKRIDTPALDFGEYAGWRIAEVAERDPRYLRWLSRHSSGVRFRSIIEQVLGPDPELGRRAAILD